MLEVLSGPRVGVLVRVVDALTPEVKGAPEAELASGKTGVVVVASGAGGWAAVLLGLRTLERGQSGS